MQPQQAQQTKGKMIRVFYMKMYPTTQEHFIWSAEVTHDRRTVTEAEFKENYSLMFTLPEVVRSEGDLSIAEEMFSVFNDYTRNPLSVENGGQTIVRESKTAHTSMSVGDIVVVGKTPYIVKNEGFEMLTFEVA